jgi:hypothetical protein
LKKLRKNKSMWTVALCLFVISCLGEKTTLNDGLDFCFSFSFSFFYFFFFVVILSSCDVRDVRNFALAMTRQTICNAATSKAFDF